LASNGTSPTAQRWELARRLKELRVQYGRSLEDVAQELMCSTAKVSRMETAARGIQKRDVRDLCRFYGLSGDLEQQLMTLATEAARQGWWSGFRTLNDETAQFVGLEAAAIESWTTHATVIPGLLQTAEYASYLLHGIKPAGELSEQARAERITIRERRQERALSGQVKVRAIIDEAALQRPIAPADVMALQVEQLAERACLPNVELQVVPYRAGAHPGMDGSFHYMRFAEGTIADAVFVEGQLGMFLMDKPADTARYRTIFEDISLHHALPPDQSIDWLRDFRRRMRTHP
jgi:hypothetical protein